jgi:hypothetical protein
VRWWVEEEGIRYVSPHTKHLPINSPRVQALNNASQIANRHKADLPDMVGLTRFELVTPRLSSVCSNQLSYRPLSLTAPKAKRRQGVLPDTALTQALLHGKLSKNRTATD